MRCYYCDEEAGAPGVMHRCRGAGTEFEVGAGGIAVPAAIAADVAYAEMMAREYAAVAVVDAARVRTSSALLQALDQPKRGFTLRQPLAKAKQWQIDFGPEKYAGVGEPAYEVGGNIVITVQPRCLFKGEKLFADDDAEPRGSGTRVLQIFVGKKMQALRDVSTTELLGGVDVKMDVCDRALCMSMVVHFLKPCAFWATILGRAVA
jgi:hypothetical protein